ncbi:MAG: hypothetical protein Q7R35_01825 [Elusimicrobiota bacterium]|nr:hypothetical protein [Elusimicrobiota bacterium]
MKKCVISVIVSLMLFPAAGALPFEGVLAATDPALAAAVRAALQDELFVAQVPAPAESSKTAPGPVNYVPFHRDGIYNYEYTSSRFTGSKLLRLEFGTFSAKDSSVTVTKTVFDKNSPQVTTFKVYLTQSGIEAGGSPLAGPRLEMPAQPAYNQTWEEGQDRSRVAAVNTGIKTASGNHTGCVRIITRLAGGGAINRYYAPGLGLVAEQLLTKDTQEMISLVSFLLR